MKKVIINADDFGMSKVFNEVILELLEKDFIKSVSVLVLRDIDNQSVQFEKLRNLSKQKDISVGLHFELNEAEKDYKKISENIEYQKEIFVKHLGFPPTHIDKHKKVYSQEEVIAMIDFATQNNIYIRDYFSEYIHENKDRIRTSNRVVFLAEKNVDDITGIASNMQDEEIMEIIAHPGKFDPNCQSSLNKDRDKDYEKVLALASFLKENNVVLINQKDKDSLKKIKEHEIKQLNINQFENILKRAWSKDSSYYPVFDGSNPALGQCAVTALVVNDYFGGEIVWCEAVQPDGQKISHYFNKVDNNEIDLTRSQFSEGTVVPAGTEKKKGFATTRDFILSNEDARTRYLILKNKIDRLLKI